MVVGPLCRAVSRAVCFNKSTLDRRIDGLVLLAVLCHLLKDLSQHHVLLVEPAFEPLVLCLGHVKSPVPAS